MPAKLFFYYSAMNAGKSSSLLQASHNYHERGMRTLSFIPKRMGKERICSRIGISAPAIQFDENFDFLPYLQKVQAWDTQNWWCGDFALGSSSDTGTATSAIEGLDIHRSPDVLADGGMKNNLACVLIDEAQFLTKDQVIQLTKVADELNIAVMCYGLRSDFVGEPFEGSMYLLTYADVLTEIKTICFCGRKATLNQRIGSDGASSAAGEQIEVWGTSQYVGKCRRHFNEGLAQAALIEEDNPNEAKAPPTKKRKVTEVTPEKEDQDLSPLSVEGATVASPPSA